MVRAGNKVAFDQDEEGVNTSNIYNKQTKVIIPIREEGSSYEFDLWVKAKKGAKPTEVKKEAVKIGNSFQALTEEVSQGAPSIVKWVFTGWCEHCKAGEME